jgi:hypothetical protein
LVGRHQSSNVVLIYSLFCHPTVHKSQGMTIDQLEVQAGRFWLDGHAYVAISRCRSLDGLYLTGLTRDKVKASALAIQFYETGGAMADGQPHGGGWWLPQPQQKNCCDEQAQVLAPLLEAAAAGEKPQDVLSIAKLKQRIDAEAEGSFAEMFKCNSCCLSLCCCRTVEAAVQRTVKLSVPRPSPNHTYSPKATTAGQSRQRDEPETATARRPYSSGPLPQRQKVDDGQDAMDFVMGLSLQGLLAPEVIPAAIADAFVGRICSLARTCAGKGDGSKELSTAAQMVGLWLGSDASLAKDGAVGSCGQAPAATAQPVTGPREYSAGDVVLAVFYPTGERLPATVDENFGGGRYRISFVGYETTPENANWNDLEPG